MNHTNNGQQYWLQEVEDFESIATMQITKGGRFISERCVQEVTMSEQEPKKDEWETLHDIQLPTGTWQIHSDSTTITEEQAGEIVEQIGVSGGGYNLYRDYEYPEDQFMTARYSYHSLLRSLGLDEKRIINLKKIAR